MHEWFAPQPVGRAWLAAVVFATFTAVAQEGSLAGTLDPIEVPASGDVLAPAIALDASGQRLILTWLERRGDRHTLNWSAFDGNAFGPAQPIAGGENWFANWADTPGLHVAEDGTWIAHWLVKSAAAPYAYDIRTTVSRDRGQSWSIPRTPHRDGTASEHGFVSYYPKTSGAGIVWLDGRNAIVSGDHPHNGAMTLRTATIGDDGRVGSSALLDQRVCDCCRTASAMTDAGPVIVYRDRDEDEVRDISIIRGVAGGWSVPASVHVDGWSIAGCPVNGPDVIARGQVVIVAWFTIGNDEPKVRLARSIDGGRSFQKPLSLSEGTALGRVRLAWHKQGFLLGWMSENPQTGAGELRLARFDANGAMISEQVLSMLESGRVSGFPQLAVLDDQALVVWTESAPGRVGRTQRTLRAGTRPIGD